MSITVKKHINEDEGNRIEYLFVNFDYFDLNDLVAKIFCRHIRWYQTKKLTEYITA